MRRPLLLLAALVLAIALFAIRLAPASLADARLAHITAGGLRLADATGTLWDARAVLVAGASRIPIAWRADPWPLFLGEARWHLVPAAGSSTAGPRADVTFRGENVTVRDAEATFPAAFAAAAIGSTAGWVIGGDVNVGSAAFVFDWAPPAIRGDLKIRWRGARLNPPGNAMPLDLGDVSAMLHADGERLSGSVTNAGGDVAMQGDVAVRATGDVELSVVLTPRRPENRELAQALSVVGTPEGGGWRVVARSPLR